MEHSASAGCSADVGQERKWRSWPPAEGILKINGQPAQNILVQFLPVVAKGDPGPTSSGVSNERGEFELEAGGKTGAVIGPCKVLFVDLNEERVAQGMQPTNPPRIPSEMSIIGPRTREVEVKEENPRFEFDIKN
ncbi:MAG: hypothetical protein JWM11_47 [Planctomycetaceae bacterium]|nr:hypothetical protein [Planctomycetaceae bacterium]